MVVKQLHTIELKLQHKNEEKQILVNYKTKG